MKFVPDGQTDRHPAPDRAKKLPFIIQKCSESIKRDYQYSGAKHAKIVVHTVQLYTRYCRLAARAAAPHTARTK